MSVAAVRKTLLGEEMRMTPKLQPKKLVVWFVEEECVGYKILKAELEHEFNIEVVFVSCHEVYIGEFLAYKFSGREKMFVISSPATKHFPWPYFPFDKFDEKIKEEGERPIVFIKSGHENHEINWYLDSKRGVPGWHILDPAKEVTALSTLKDVIRFQPEIFQNQ